MGILERTRHVVRADLDALVRKAKNPEAVLEGYLDDLQSVLEECESLQAAERAEHGVFQARLRDLAATQSSWENKARTCLRNGDEDLARTALERKIALDAERHELERELEHRSASQAVLDESIEALRLRIAEVARKQRELRYRRQVIEARSQLQRAMGQLAPDADEPVLTEAEDGLAAAESHIEAAEAAEAEDLERRSRKLEAADRRRLRDKQLDDALAALKRDLEREPG